MRVILALVLTIVVLARAEAQETTGDIRGRLVTSTGTPIAGATVVATSPNFLGARRAVSATDGVFQLFDLPPGTYSVRITRIGFQPTTIDSVRVQLGRMRGLAETELKEAAAQLGAVRISAPGVTLDPARTTIGATLEASELAALPGGRDYTAAMAILPHMNPSYHGDAVNSAGSTGLENMYFIDGVNVTSPLRADKGTSLPYNFVQSVEVRAGGYEAQYGRALGAIVNAVTYTGTNTFETSVFGFLSHSELAGRPRAQPVLQEARSISYDIGVRVSGPMVRDRLWFSAAYNPRKSSADRLVEGLGTFVDHSRSDIFAGKLTWQPDSATDVALSVFGDPTIHHEVAPITWLPGLTPVNADPYLNRLEKGGVSVLLQGRRTVGAGILLEASVGLTRMQEDFEAATPRGRSDLLLVDRTALTIGGGSWGHQLGDERRNTGTLRATIPTGRHTFGVGFEFDESRLTSDFASDFGERYSATSFTIVSQRIAGTFGNQAPAAYVQDAWRVTSRLTINAGVRWESQRLIAPTGQTAQRFADEWQPRVGFSQMLGAAHQRVFGSYGRFYQQQPLWLSSLYYADYLGTRGYYSTDPRVAGVQPDSLDDFSNPGSLYIGSIEGASAERFDEVTAGYERLVGSSAQLTLRAMHRHLGTTFQQGFDLVRQAFYLGTPGKGNLAFLPRARRDYTALELDVIGTWRAVRYRASYVLSRAWGNFPGLYDSDVYLADPGANYIMNLASQAPNSTGLLPNDRTHVFKASGTIALGPALVLGTSVFVASGTPLNEFGVDRDFPDTARPTFLVPRGSLGRTPTVCDVNLRLSYSPSTLGRRRTTLLLDVLHVGNLRTAVRVDQQRFLPPDASGSQVLNPTFGNALSFVPPMAVKLGAEIRF